MPPRPMPAAELEVSAGLVRRLLAAQHPDLAERPVVGLANGWDNVLCRVGDDLIARLPRRAAAARLIEHELRWLPVLAPGLPLLVPVPVRAGRPGPGYPWRWSIVPFLPGRAATVTPPADPDDAGVRLGRFLAALHTPAAPDAPANATRGIPLAGRHESVMDNLDAINLDEKGPAGALPAGALPAGALPAGALPAGALPAGALPAGGGGRIDRAAVLAAWYAALAAPDWAGPPVWLHGDLHPANLLVAGGKLRGVIDFGDLTAGDPAADLSVAWMLLPAASRDTFRAAYLAGCQHQASGATAALWARARGWALALSLVFLAHSADNPELRAVGQRTLSAVLG